MTLLNESKLPKNMNMNVKTRLLKQDSNIGKVKRIVEAINYIWTN